MSSQTHQTHAGLKPYLFLALIIILSLTQVGWTSLPQTPPPPDKGQVEGFRPTEPGTFKTQAVEPVTVSKIQTNATWPPTAVITASDAEYFRELPNNNDVFGAYLDAGLSKYDGEGTRLYRSALRFSLAKIPPNVNITSAVLTLTLGSYFDYTNIGTREIRLYRLASTWHQSVVTWARQPAAAEQVASMQVGKTLDVAYDVDLTSLVRGWYTGTAANYGIMLAGSEGDYGNRSFYSNDSPYAPTLTVTYYPTAPTLKASPSVMLFADTQSSPKAGTLVVTNKGTTRLDWKIDSLPSWLTVSSTSGSLGPDLSEDVSLTPNLSGLTPDTSTSYTGTVQLSSTTPGVSGSPVSVPVTLFYSTDGPSRSMLPIIFNAAPASGPSAAAQKVVALVIGIREYKYIQEGTTPALAGIHVDSWGTPLRTVDNLPGDMGQITLNAALNASTAAIAGTGPVVSSGNTTVMMLRNEQAAYADIERAFKWLDAQEDENTRVIVMYAGHGGQMLDFNGDETGNGGDGYDEMLTTWDTDDYGGNVITDDTLNTWLKQLESKQVAVFIDACNSGGFSELAASNPNLLLMMSSKETESSVESDAYALSLFSYELGAAMLDPTADTNKDGSVSAQEAFVYLKPKVIGEASQYGELQTPQMVNNLATEFPLSRP